MRVRHLIRSGWLWILMAQLPLYASDLKIVTTHRLGERLPPATQTKYIKGQRIRQEWRNSLGSAKHAGDPLTYTYGPRMAVIYQCDQRRVVEMDLEHGEFRDYEIDEYGLPVGALQKAKPLSRTGATVDVTIETRDTGERKEIFGHTARRVITRTKTVAPPGACTSSSESEVDGWYIDLAVPGRCFERPEGHPAAMSFLASSCGEKADNLEVHRTGQAEMGFPVKLTNTTSSEIVLPDGTTKQAASTFEIEVVELSEEPLDSQLFEVPSGFRRVSKLHSEPPTPGSMRPHLFWERIKAFFTSLFD